MTFKEWLLNESGSDHGGSFFYGLQLYPSDALDYPYAASHPAEMNFLQNRWKKERKIGRKFINIDEPRFQKISYVSVQSESMPGAGPGFWKHQQDANPNLRVVPFKHLKNLAVGKNSQDLRVLKNVNKPVKIDLEKIFGDKGTESVPQLSDDFDKPWTKIYEFELPYDVLAPNATVGVKNANMGIRSKYVCPDETGEKEMGETKPGKTADFGFDRWRRKNSKKLMRRYMRSL